MEKRKDLLDKLCSIVQLRPFGDSGLKEGARGFMKGWLAVTMIIMTAGMWLWFHFGEKMFHALWASIFFAFVAPCFAVFIDLLNFRKDVDHTAEASGRIRVIVAFILTLFSCQALVFTFFMDDILIVERTQLIQSANARIDQKWDPQIKTAEEHLAVANARLEKDRETTKARQKQEMDQALAAEKNAMDAVHQNALHATANAGLRTKSLQKAVDEQRKLIEALQVKHKKELAADDKNVAARTEAETIVTDLRAQKASESRTILQKDRDTIEKTYGIAAKDGVIDHAKTLYVDLPKEKGVSVWLWMFFWFVIVFLFELGPYFGRRFAPVSLVNYYKQSYQDEIRRKRENAYTEICLVGEPVMQAIAEWRKRVDEEIAHVGSPNIDAFNELLRRLWVECVDHYVVELYNASARKDDEEYEIYGKDLLEKFLSQHDYTDLRYQARPWYCDEQKAEDLWHWKPTGPARVVPFSTARHS